MIADLKSQILTKRIDISDRQIVVAFNYNQNLVNLVKDIKPKGVFVNADKHWVFELDALENVCKALIPVGFELSDSTKKYIKNLEDERKTKTSTVANRKEVCMNFLKEDCINWKYQPFDHQWEGVEFLISLQAGILADMQGIGKTMTTLITAKALQHYYNEDVVVYVLCPVSLQLNWIKEAANVNMTIEVFSHAKIPLPPKYKKFILITDEVHAMQSMKSQRSKAFLNLALDVNCVHLYCLSGTPMKNGRPSNIYPVLKACRHPIAVNRKFYDLRYCDAKQTKFTKWDTTGATNLEELSREISDILIRRTKDECLDLPPKIVQSIECQKTKELELQYNRDIEELKEKYYERVSEGLISEVSEAIVFLGYFRRMASKYKIEEAVNMAQELLTQDESVVIFTEFKDTANTIAERFGVQPFTGDTKLEERQKMVDDFQAGITKVFVGTIKAGGVGITLTKASYNLILDFPWTPGDLEQAEDRCHRIGTTRTVNIYNFYAKEIDYIMAAVIGQKSDKISQVLKKKKIDMSRERDSTFFIDLLQSLV